MSTAMNILHVYSSNTAGGAEKMMIDLATALETRGLRNIITGPKGSYLLQKAAEKKLTAYPLKINGSFDPIGILGLRSIVLKESVDVIHAHQGKVFWPCVFMKLFVKPRLKLVFHRHAQLPHSFYSRGHYTSADKVIAISKAVAAGLIEREKVSPEKVRVVYNGIDTARFNRNVSGSAVRDEYSLNGKFVIGTAAAMNRPKGKGQEYLIRAAAELKGRFKDLRYLIVGDGEIMRELKKTAEDLGVSDIVHFAGYRENIENYMAAMDVFCLLSWDTEGLGQVMMEAQAMGKPVIGTNVGGVPETFLNGKTGLLIPPENVSELAGAAAFFASDHPRAAAFGKAGEELVRRDFTIEKMAEAVASIYSEA